MPRVSAAVLNYNGRHLLEVILPSLAAQSYDDFEVVVIDNGSNDDSREYLRCQWPQVRVVACGPPNIGVAAALNVAVRSSAGDLIALLNNDLELAPDWIAQMVGALDRHPETATAACKLLRYHERDVLDGAGNLFARSATGWQRGQGEKDAGQFDTEEEVFAPTAGAGLYRASAFATVGPFDESLWAYFEDVDWSLRAQLAGLRCVYVPAAVAYHMGSRTTGGDTDPFYFQLQRRNTVALLVKDVPLGFIWRNAHHILLHHLYSLLLSARVGRLRMHLRALRAAFRASPGWRRERRRIIAGSRIDPGDFDRFVG